MECAEHAGRAAIGLCRACLRGVCRDCAEPQRLGLACRGRCEADVRALAATLEQSMRTAALSSGLVQGTPRLWAGLAVVSLSVGVFVIVFGLSLPEFRTIALLGLPFLAIGGLVLAMLRRLRAGAPPAAPR
jgi:hypothetical protein